MMEQEIAIRSVQHYLYCPHRWGLMEIDKAWAENVFVTKANLMHNRVHDPDKHYTGRRKKVYTSVWVYNDMPEYNLYGVTDCLEVTDSGICIAEYKPTQPQTREYNEDDLMQVFAQKICVDHIFQCDCDAVIYYANVKKRVRLPLRENFSVYDEMLRGQLAEMREYLKAGHIPAIREGQQCNGCSMRDLCMPKLKRHRSVRDMIARIDSEESEIP